MITPGGHFRILDPKVPDGYIRIKNLLLKQGAQRTLQVTYQAAAATPASYYMGLTNVTENWNSTLADLAAGEPVGNGYARQAIAKNNVDWTVQEVNGFMQALSKIVTFTASANWDKQWNRMFITDQAAGTAGYVWSVSGPAPSLRTVLTGAGPSCQYEYFLRG